MNCGHDECKICPIPKDTTLEIEMKKLEKSERLNNKTLTSLKNFLERSIQYHNKDYEHYDYRLIPSHYKTAKFTTPIYCNRCELVIWQEIHTHCGTRRKSGCQNCSYIDKITPFKDFEKKVTSIHKELYKLEEKTYKGSSKHVKICVIYDKKMQSEYRDV